MGCGGSKAVAHNPNNGGKIKHGREAAPTPDNPTIRTTEQTPAKTSNKYGRQQSRYLDHYKPAQPDKNAPKIEWNFAHNISKDLDSSLFTTGPNNSSWGNAFAKKPITDGYLTLNFQIGRGSPTQLIFGAVGITEFKTKDLKNAVLMKNDDLDIYTYDGAGSVHN